MSFLFIVHSVNVDVQCPRFRGTRLLFVIGTTSADNYESIPGSEPVLINELIHFDTNDPIQADSMSTSCTTGSWNMLTDDTTSIPGSEPELINEFIIYPSSSYWKDPSIICYGGFDKNRKYTFQFKGRQTVVVEKTCVEQGWVSISPEITSPDEFNVSVLPSNHSTIWKTTNDPTQKIDKSRLNHPNQFVGKSATSILGYPSLPLYGAFLENEKYTIHFKNYVMNEVQKKTRQCFTKGTISVAHDLGIGKYQVTVDNLRGDFVWEVAPR